MTTRSDQPVPADRPTSPRALPRALPPGVGRLAGGDPAGVAAVAARVTDLLAAVAPTAGAPRPPTTAAELASWVAAMDVCPAEPVPWPRLTAEVTQLTAAGVNPAHRWSVAHLHVPTLVEAAAVEAVIGATNQSMDSADQAPAATVVEDHVVRWLAAELRLPATASGVLTAGGTASNLLALVLARAALARRLGLPSVHDHGLPPEARRWRIVTSDTAHFSVAQAASVLGLGRAAVVSVATDAAGAIDPDALRATMADLRAQGSEVLAVVATAGTTDTGAIDPLAAVAAEARRARAWFHVDAAVGAAFVVSDRLRPRLAGIEHADSVTADFHKLWWQPIGASALLVAREADFELIRLSTDYLNRAEDEDLGVLNLVNRSLDTSRRFDALKVLVSLRATGRTAMGAMVEHLVDLTAAVAAWIEADPRFELVADPCSTMVLFRWVGGPPGSAHRPADEVMDATNTAVARALFDDGTAVLGRTRHRGRVALKATIVNPASSVEDLVELLEVVAARAPGHLPRPVAVEGDLLERPGA